MKLGVNTNNQCFNNYVEKLKMSQKGIPFYF